MRRLRLQMMAGGQIPPDPDAVAFLTATGITDPTISLAIDTLVKELKAYGIWTKMKALYPFVGGTASTHKFNLKDPQDTNAAFRLQFVGGWTHSSTGALPNGTNAYANTFLTPFTSLFQNSAHLSYYSRTNFLIGGMDIGVFDLGTLVGTHLGISYSGNLGQMRARINSSTPSTTYTPTNTGGLFSISRIAAASFKGYRNGASQFTQLSSTLSPPNFPIYLGAIDLSTVASDYSNKESALASIGDGLDDTEMANFYAAVQSFQTTLGRQV